MKYDVFISFGEQDAETARHIKQVLEKNGISCFFAPDLAARGEDYATEALEAIDNCDVFLLILSNSAQNSKWVKRELSRALDSDKRIFPFIVEDFELNKEFNFMLAQTQRVSAFLQKDEALSQLVQQIKEAVGGTEPAPRQKSRRILPLIIAAAVIAAAVLIFVLTLPKNDDPAVPQSEKVIMIQPSTENAGEDKAAATAGFTGETGACVFRFDADTDTMYLSGEGSMADYTNQSEPQPWKDLNKRIKHVVIEEGVTNVGDGAFKNCLTLEDVTLPSGVTSIGIDAFYLCRNLNSVNIPDTVTAIGEAAFAGCSRLETLRIPVSVAEFGKDVFYRCGQLTVICAQDSAAYDYAVQNNIAYQVE